MTSPIDKISSAPSIPKTKLSTGPPLPAKSRVAKALVTPLKILLPNTGPKRKGLDFNAIEMLVAKPQDFQQVCVISLPTVLDKLTHYHEIPKVEVKDRITALRELIHTSKEEWERLKEDPHVPREEVIALQELIKQATYKKRYLIALEKHTTLQGGEYRPLHSIQLPIGEAPIQDLVTRYNELKKSEMATRIELLTQLKQELSKMGARAKLPDGFNKPALAKAANQVEEKLQYLEYLASHGREEPEVLGFVEQRTAIGRVGQRLKYRMERTKAWRSIAGAMGRGERPISELYWLERIDPLHRSWKEESLQKVKKDWVESGISSLFLYLESVEDSGRDPTSPTVAKEKVEYLSPAEREQYKLTFGHDADGKAHVYRNGKLYGTEEESSDFSGKGTGIFVLGLDGEVYVGSHMAGKKHHSSFFGGATVFGAGEIKIEQGRIVEISDKSGHYKPEAKHMLKMLEVLHRKYGDLSGITLKLMQKRYDACLKSVKAGDKEEIVYVCFDAEEFLKTRGQCPSLETVSAQGIRPSWSPLHTAVWNGQQGVVNQLLDEEPSEMVSARINARDPSGATPLHLAMENRVRIREYLSKEELRQGSGIYRIDWTSYRHIADSLCVHGADVNARDAQGKTPLHTAIEQSNWDALQWLLTQPHVDLYAEDQDGYTPLLRAVERGHYEAVKLLVSTGGVDSLRSSHGSRLGTPLDMAAATGNLTMMELLIHLGATIPRQNRTTTPLHRLSEGVCDEKMATLLVQAGIAIDAENSAGKTPLHLAAYKLNSHNIGVLGRLGADVAAQDDRGNTPLHAVLQSSLQEPGDTRTRALKAILSLARTGDDFQGVVNSRNKEGNTPLHAALLSGLDWSQLQSPLETLLAHGADINALNDQQETPLHLAVRKKDVQAILFLLEHGARTDIPNASGHQPFELKLDAQENTLLHVLTQQSTGKAQSQKLAAFISAGKAESAKTQDTEAQATGLIKRLIALGLPLDSKNKDGRTPLLAIASSTPPDPALITLFIENGASSAAQDAHGATMLHLLIQSGESWDNLKPALDALLKSNIDLNAQDHKGNTPLHYAVALGNYYAIEYLICQGAKTSIVNHQDQKPFDVLIGKGKEAVPLLHKLIQDGSQGWKLQMELIRDWIGFMIEHGCPLDAQDAQSNTALHLLLQSNLLNKKDRNAILKIFLNHKANIAIKNAEGKTVGDLILASKSARLLVILVESKVPLLANMRRQILHIADRLTPSAASTRLTALLTTRRFFETH